MEGRGEVVILSSNNYLGLCNEPAVVAAGIEGLKKFGAGTGSVRFICGTFTIHRELEKAIARSGRHRGIAVSYVSAWNANEGLTATIVEQGDFVVSDALNHASIIDSHPARESDHQVHDRGLRSTPTWTISRPSSRARRDAKRRIIWTDGVFSMEGSIAKLPEILELRAGTTTRSSRWTTRTRTGVLGANWTRHGRAFRRARRSRRHHVDARQGAWWRCGRIRRRAGVAVRHADPAVAATAVLQRPAADRRGERACGDPVARSTTRSA